MTISRICSHDRFIQHIILTLLLLCCSVCVAGDQLAPPPQDQGLPYTRSAQPKAMEAIHDYIALFPGSRYAYVFGYRVRLDDDHWRDEAVIVDGELYVPVSFASLVPAKSITPPPAPEYLAPRWVYQLDRRAAELPSTIRTREISGHKYVAISDVVRYAGKSVAVDASGLVLIGNDPATTPVLPRGVLCDAVISQFDTPEKFANPDLATKYIPTLARQGKWTDHVQVSPEQLAILNNGPETQWAYTPAAKYDLRGFNQSLLGSKIPPPGEYPRVLFSAEDLPEIARRIQASEFGRRSWIERSYLLNKTFWDPSTSDGKVFQKLASGDVSHLHWPDLKDGGNPADVQHVFKDEKPGITNSHIAYVPEALMNMALQCLLEQDDTRGRQVAAAIVNYFKLREPLVDEWLSVSDSEFATSYVRPNGKVAIVNGNGSTTQWRGMHGVVAHMNLALCLDFAGKWMTADEKAFMQRFIAKATYGRRAFGQDGSPRFRDINWVSWDLPNYLALLAIEGTAGCDTEAIESNRETLRAFCEFGIDEAGVVFESNGKTPGGFQFLLLSMIAQSRRGDNLFGHPHFRKLLEGQVQMTSPTGKVIVNSGTQYVPYSRQVLSPQLVMELKAFFPDERIADYLLTQVAQRSAEDPADETSRYYVSDADSTANYQQRVATLPRLRMASPTYPGFVRSFLYDADYQPATRADLNLPLDFSAPTHGVFSAYSDDSPDATWVNMMVRPDHYLGGGHHHADAGIFHFSALGIDWITESPFPQAYAGKYHNQVLVDGISQAQPPGDEQATAYQAAGSYLGTSTAKDASFASADLTNSYSWTWQTQPPPVWPQDGRKWELDPSPRLMEIFAGTARYKMRPWWMSSNYSNYIATSRAPFNPMKYVYRSVGLVRGDRPYAIVMDDLLKDDQPHLYQWTAMLNGGVAKANVASLASNQIALGYRTPKTVDGPDALSPDAAPGITPERGEPLVLVVVLSPQSTASEFIDVKREKGILDKTGKQLYYDRVSAAYKGQSAAFRVLLIPYRFADELPAVSYDADKQLASVRFAGHTDELQFAVDPGTKRTTAVVSRNGEQIGKAN